MTRLEEITAELEQLARRLCACEDIDCACAEGVDIRALMRTLERERDDLPRQR